MSTAKNLEPHRPPHLRAVSSDESLPSFDPYAAWRTGKPAEDPEKTKRWGIVTAKPSEYLVHMRRGKIRRRSTGQGASCFKLPWDSVAVIPTTINRLQFTADQVTLEKVGMRVTGLAVYRIVEPEIAFRMLNFSYAERASQKLAEIMREMFVGATRRHVANLRVEDVMTRRKDAIAGELLAELAPVLAGRGQVDDSTAMGWGVVLDTVEIQDVRVLSEEVFANMQATYRAELAARAREAQLEREALVAARETEHARALEKAQLEAEAERRRLRAAAESRSTEIELSEEGKRAELRAAAERVTIERERAEKIARLQAEAAVKAEEAERVEQARRTALERQARLLEAQQQLDAREHATALMRQQQEAERRNAQAEADRAHEDAAAEAQAQLRRRQLELDRLTGELESALALARRRVDDTVSPERIQLELVSRTLPAMAEAFAQQIGELRVTQIGTSDDPSTMLVRGMAQMIEVARGLGLRLPGTDTGPVAR
ncbi:SPFH domain-containing protein [Paraliomyxa miuraensis]|uniref:SPFH domain-containing protein n=1 Tax=Paraliomyxa miuraensis TaxID=376150 RepID=UPI00225C3D2A|nr:SPFH domain-containing protein [Paraliomyxa miuraensis]